MLLISHFPLLLIQEDHLSVTGKNMCTSTEPAQEVKKLTDWLDMSLTVLTEP